jgi:hypothetical protein
MAKKKPKSMSKRVAAALKKYVTGQNAKKNAGKRVRKNSITFRGAKSVKVTRSPDGKTIGIDVRREVKKRR